MSFVYLRLHIKNVALVIGENDDRRAIGGVDETLATGDVFAPVACKLAQGVHFHI